MRSKDYPAMDDPHYTRPYSSSAPGSKGRRIDQARLLAAHHRDAALARIGSTRRLVIVGAAGLSAAFAALVYALAPGHSLSSARAATGHPSTSKSTVTTRSSQPKLPAPAGASALGLGGASGGGSSSSSSSSGSSAPAAPQSSPTPAPTPAPSSPPVTSGGS
ncbi:MAG TPA: hypothetical protein VG321_02880 [Solirubrobacteraceae bacterium]|nr:hypothetical protein [Solirubrobacteraceae bacterium]